MITLAHQVGSLSQVGVSSAQADSLGAPLVSNSSRKATIPLADVFVKYLNFISGAVDSKVVASQLINLAQKALLHRLLLESSKSPNTTRESTYRRASKCTAISFRGVLGSKRRKWFIIRRTVEQSSMCLDPQGSRDCTKYISRCPPTLMKSRFSDLEQVSM